MTMFKITKEEAVKRLKHSLAIKEATRKEVEERLAREGIKGKVVSI